MERSKKSTSSWYQNISITVFCFLLTACTIVNTQQSSYITLGKADITECEQMVFPDGQTTGKEAIGFDCKKYESSGVSGEFAGIMVALIDAIPGLPWLRKVLL